MKYFSYCIPIVLMLLAGCTTLNLVMKVDPTLEANAVVYEMTSEGKLTDKKLNVSFGAYRVADADSSWVSTSRSTEDEISLTNGISITRNTVAENVESNQSISYKFNVGDEVTWDSQCSHHVKKRVTESNIIDNMSILESISSQYTCRYTRGGGETWTLSVRQNDLTNIDISMTDGERIFTAHATGGKYVRSDGQPYNGLTSRDAGYTWTEDNKNIAAVSTWEKTPRVWLDKRNPDSMNHVLSMASTGVLMYDWVIAHTLSGH